MKIRKKIGALLTACAMLCGGIGMMPANAADDATAQEEFVPGDIDCDGCLNRTDIIYVNYWLTHYTFFTADTVDNGFQYLRADMDGDGTLTAADLTLMKRQLISEYGTKQSDWPGGNPTSPEEDPEAWLPMQKSYEHQLQTYGERRVLMVVINFPDYPLEGGFTAEEIQARCFGPEDKESPAYPFESISAFYDRASGGKLKLSGDVFTYTAQKNLLDYYKFLGYAVEGHGLEPGTEILLKQDDLIRKEALDALTSSGQLDLSRYDSDENGCLDSVIFVVPYAMQKLQYGLDSKQLGSYDWWPGYSALFCGETIVDDGFSHNKVRYYTIQGGADILDQASFNNTWAHELGHAMGLDDLYNTNAGDGEDPETMHGEAGFELMMAGGELSAFSKVRLGWCTPENMQVYTGGNQEFTLNSNQTTRDFLVIPQQVPAEGNTFGFGGDYFIVELNTPEENCTGAFEEAGVRILHFNGRSFVGLVNDGNGFFRAGDAADGSVPGFTWQDGAGVDVWISVDEIADGQCKLTILQRANTEIPPGETPPVETE